MKFTPYPTKGTKKRQYVVKLKETQGLVCNHTISVFLLIKPQPIGELLQED